MRILIEIGKYTLEITESGYFLTNDGEGVEIYEVELERLLEKHYKENF